MEITRHVIVFDARELEPESAFWAAMLGGTVDVEDDWHSVQVNGAAVVDVQLVPDHTPPDWPDGVPQQIHLDLMVTDARAAHDEAIALGARLLQGGRDLDAPGFQVYADPAGHPFCLCWD